MPARRSAHPSTRQRAGRPPRQRHAQASAHRAKKRAGAHSGAGSNAQSGTTHRWSKAVNERSDAMDVEQDIFKTGSAKQIAQSLKKSSEHSRRRKGTPYQSAMSMLNFYINRAGRNLPKTRRDTLQQAKKELRSAFGR